MYNIIDRSVKVYGTLNIKTITNTLDLLRVMYFICKAVDMAPQPIRCLWSGDNKHLKQKKKKKKSDNLNKIMLLFYKLSYLKVFNCPKQIITTTNLNFSFKHILNYDFFAVWQCLIQC